MHMIDNDRQREALFKKKSTAPKQAKKSSGNNEGILAVIFLAVLVGLGLWQNEPAPAPIKVTDNWILPNTYVCPGDWKLYHGPEPHARRECVKPLWK